MMSGIKLTKSINYCCICTKPSLGFTLIEVLVTVAIIGILAAIAYPSYMDQVRKSARAEAMSSVMDAANKLEQFYVDNRVYTTSLSDIGVNSTTESDFYTLSISTSEGGHAFEIKAQASGGPAAQDTDCTSFTITDTGKKGSSGSGGVGLCWGN